MTAPNRDAGFGERATDIVDTVKAYAKQEVVDPLRGIGRFLIFGVVGSVLLGIGTVLLALAALRALQEDTGTVFTGNWSWAPYLIVALLLAAVLLVVVTRINRVGRTTEEESR